MTERQQRFVDHYIQTANASEATSRSGYSERTAGVIGDENLKKPYVREAISERLNEMERGRVADTQEILEHLTVVVRGEVTEVIVTNRGKSFSVPVSERDRLRAAEHLLKVQGAFKDKTEMKMTGADLFVDTLKLIRGKLDNG